MKKFVVLLLTFSFLLFFAHPAKAAAASQFIIINKSKNELAYYENTRLKSVFKVATGRQKSYTPEGKFKVVNKIVNRPYYSGHIPGGDPRNPLGNRWLGLNARGTWGTTYAIHGNNNAKSIGTYASAGCIRMYNNEVQWLFTRVKVNTPVVIVSSSKSYDSIASAYGLKGKGSSLPAYSTGTLKKGSKGEAVKELQKLLTQKGYSTKGIDGIFGKNTDSAVRKFQKVKKLKVDGLVGPATKKALGML
ncbi:L,D-transpeptidase family protein [Fictibacillus enclensis]|uniref:L,D-transpeptidase family protein n=1 Tax=Fictibacillus enclensis TaxID=1017270 RepID=UPI0024BFE9F0|nr:L,D-transpeptidase family protein [Fictibacillus enclensis]MDM5199430.1 L,D-transpeptidase family protein [Fictibacillus enclensis]MDM5338666.1 L,D-transpeptidase family protein [Fictibacillus enclensis]WHY70167.1 L,D-transpeptidase family protein [Fictibacillus enclensis]